MSDEEIIEIEGHKVAFDRDPKELYPWYYECLDRNCDITGYGCATKQDAVQYATRKHKELDE